MKDVDVDHELEPEPLPLPRRARWPTANNHAPAEKSDASESEPSTASRSRGRLPAPEEEPEEPQPVNAAELLADKGCEPPPEIIKGILHQGSRLVLGGHSKSYKSYLLLDAALSVQAGQPFLGWPTVPGRVLYINMELAAWSIRKRIAAVAEAKRITDVSRLDLLNLRGTSGWDAETMAAKVRSTLRTQPYALAIVDPVYKLLGGLDENSAGTITQVMDTLGSVVARCGVSMMYAAHYAKGNAAAKEAADRISGSGVWMRDADAALLLTKHREEARRAYTVDLILRDLPEQRSFVVEWQHPLMARAADLDPGDLKRAGGRPSEHQMAEVLKVLPAAGLKTKDWQAAAADAGIPRACFYRLKQQAMDTDSVVLTEGRVWRQVS